MTPVFLSTSNDVPSPALAWFSPRAQIVTATCACAAASALLFAVDPAHHAIFPQCLLYQTTGVYCAGCGATRAIHALLHGRVLEALHDNALFISALPIILYVAATQAHTAWRTNAWPNSAVNGRKFAWGAAALVVMMLAFMLARNLPGPAFDCLRPL